MTEPRDPAANLVGTVLAGRYRILELLGVGAMGTVYLGEHIKIGRRDAIKVLRESLATDREATLRFLRGARNVSAIRHPNVCTIYDFSDTADGLQFLAMELVQGESLKDVLDREGRLPLERAIHITVQTADALQAAHDAGIVHRDLKPGNIMLDKARDGRDQVKVVDFDIAKADDSDGEELTRTGFVVGTPEYMSPEQLMGERLDGRSDVYSLALVLFRTLTGSLPFRAETTQDVMILRLTQPPLRLTEAWQYAQFPDRLQHAIDRALERRASDRWPNAAEFARELNAIVAAPEAVWSTPAAAAPARPAVLATRVGPASSPAAAAPTVVVPAVGLFRYLLGRPRTRRTVAVGAGVTFSLALVLAVGAVLLNRDGDAQTAPNGDTTLDPLDPGTGLAGDAPDSPSDPPVTGDDARTQNPIDDPGRGNTGGGGRPGGGGSPDGPVNPSGDRLPATADDPPSTPAIVIPAASARAVLDQQLRLFPDEVGAVPPDAVLRAITDTASAIWDMRALSAADRAHAAFVLGTVYDSRRNWQHCASWLDSAVALNPTLRGYALLRTRCLEQIR